MKQIIIVFILAIITTSKKIPLCTVPNPIKTLSLSTSPSVIFGQYSPEAGVVGTWNNPTIGEKTQITVYGWPSRKNIVLRIQVQGQGFENATTNQNSTAVASNFRKTFYFGFKDTQPSVTMSFVSRINQSFNFTLKGFQKGWINGTQCNLTCQYQVKQYIVVTLVAAGQYDCWENNLLLSAGGLALLILLN